MSRLLAISALMSLAACTVDSDIAILEPMRGAMLPAGWVVGVKLDADGDGVLVNGKAVPGEGKFQVNVPPVDGLGFVWARRQESDFYATRSWHQGHYLPAYDWHPATLEIRADSTVFNGGKVSLSTLAAEIIAGQELVSFVKENPLTMSVPMGLVPVKATVNVDSVRVTSLSAKVSSQAARLYFDLTLKDVKVRYRTKASIFSTTGVGTYATMRVKGAILPAPGGSKLGGITVTADNPQINDSLLPSVAIQALALLFSNKLNTAVSDAAARTALALVDRMLVELRPTVGVAFASPITQASSMETVSLDTSGGMTLGFKTLIQAATPRVALKGHGVLKRTVKAPASKLSAAVVARVGAPLVNQTIFAAWDAGNMEGIRFTRAELEQLGMEKLAFPYSQLDHVTVRLLLPPLLSWRGGMPWLDVGGVEVKVVVNVADDPMAWTATSVPVALVGSGRELRIKHDTGRKVSMYKVGFDSLNSVADHDAVHRILRTSVPGVINRVIGSLPQVVLPTIQLSRLDGSKGPSVKVTLQSIRPATDHWALGLGLSR